MYPAKYLKEKKAMRNIRVKSKIKWRFLDFGYCKQLKKINAAQREIRSQIWSDNFS